MSPIEDRLPDAEFLRLRTALDEAGYQLRYDEQSVAKLKELRILYEPYLEALSRFLFISVPPWILAKEISGQLEDDGVGTDFGTVGDAADGMAHRRRISFRSLLRSAMDGEAAR